MRLTLSAVLLCTAALGCQPNKREAQPSPMPAAAGVLNVPSAPAASYTPPPAPQPIVYDTPAQRQQPVIEDAIVDASDYVSPPPAPRYVAPRPAAQRPAGTRYTVKKGESLWIIARNRYGDGNKWTRIAAANPKINPDRVQPGQTIILP